MDTINRSYDLHFFIISSGLNCSRFVLKCYESMKNQTYPNWSAVMISDGSVDHTHYELRKIKDKRVKTFHKLQNSGAAFHRYHSIHENNLSPETVIVFLGMDDELFPDALAEIKKQYDAGKWMTYGNWVNQHGKGLPKNFQLEFDVDIHMKRDYRKVTYRSTSPNTFKKFLFDRIPESDFIIDGKWIKATTESEVMFSCLEMCGKKRIGVIHKPIYLYNQYMRTNARNRFGVHYQNNIYQQIINRPKKNLYVKSNSGIMA